MGVSRSRPRRGPGTRRHREEWARGEGSGAGGEAGRQRCGGAPCALFRRSPGSRTFTRWGCPAPHTAVLRSFCRWPASVRSGSAPATHQPPPLHLGQRTPPLASRGPHPGPPSCPCSPPVVPFFPQCPPPVLYSISLPWRSPLWRGPETFLPARAARGTIVVICVCPSSPGTGHMDRSSLAADDRLPCPVRDGTGQLDSDTGPEPRQLGARGFPASLDTCTPPTDAAPPGPPHVLPLHGHGHPIGWTPGIVGSDWLMA